MRPIAVVLAVLVAATVPALALAGDREEVQVAGRCIGASEVKLKLSQEDGRIEVELEVDQNRNGVRWRIVLREDGRKVFMGTRTTRAPSGSSEIRRVLPDSPGMDRISARATSPSGEVCRAAATF